LACRGLACLLALGAPIPRDDGALADAIAAAGLPFTKTSKTSKTVAMHQPLFIGFRIEGMASCFNRWGP
jgi:hypothetical protein